jgi:hypothetical protein
MIKNGKPSLASLISNEKSRVVNTLWPARASETIFDVVSQQMTTGNVFTKRRARNREGEKNVP